MWTSLLRVLRLICIICEGSFYWWVFCHDLLTASFSCQALKAEGGDSTPPAAPRLTQCASTAVRDACRQTASLGCMLVVSPPCRDFTWVSLPWKCCHSKGDFQDTLTKTPSSKLNKLPLWLHVIIQDLFDTDWSLVTNITIMSQTLSMVLTYFKNYQVNHIAVRHNIQLGTLKHR